MEALNPLMSAGKLGVLVFQFPPWFIYKSENLDIILKYKGLSGRNLNYSHHRHDRIPDRKDQTRFHSR